MVGGIGPRDTFPQASSHRGRIGRALILKETPGRETSTLRFVLGDQLTPDMSSLEDLDPAREADAFQWVELPNTHGMALFADGGILASKPYAASGRYIHRMSDYCDGCPFNPKESLGPDACPFNFLYWDFLARNRELLEGNARMGLVLASLDRMDRERVSAIRSRARDFLNALE